MHITKNNKTKKNLLKTAESLFANYGYDGTTIRAISEQSGSSSAMINYYFGSKESLYHAIFENHLEEMVQGMNDIEHYNLNPKDRLKVFLEYYCGRISTNQEYYRILFSQLFGIQNPTIMEIVSTLRTNIFHFLQKAIEEGVQQGLFIQVDNQMFAMNIMTLLPALHSSNKSFLNLKSNIELDLSQRVNKYFLSNLILSVSRKN